MLDSVRFVPMPDDVETYAWGWDVPVHGVCVRVRCKIPPPLPFNAPGMRSRRPMPELWARGSNPRKQGRTGGPGTTVAMTPLAEGTQRGIKGNGALAFRNCPLRDCPGNVTSPHLTSPHLTSPHLTSPHLTSPHLTSPHLTSPHLTSPHLTLPHHTLPHLAFTPPLHQQRCAEG